MADAAEEPARLDGEEVSGQASASASTQPPPMKNAFSELMSPKKKKPAPGRPTSTTPALPSSNPQKHLSTTAEHRSLNAIHGRDALGVYIASPTAFPPTRVVSHNEHFVVIHDAFPKSSIHLLLLPRDSTKQLLHPFDALDGTDAAFLAAVQAETAKLRALAASELRRRFGRLSAQDAPRNAALDAADADDAGDGGAAALPPGRDWAADIISGVHAGPSMNHLHVHVLSVDRVNECMRDRRHYNSFATPFLVPVEDFPLAADDPRRRPGRAGYLEWELQCWRCGKGFGRAFAKLKRHLDEEFEGWKRE